MVHLAGESSLVAMTYRLYITIMSKIQHIYYLCCQVVRTGHSNPLTSSRTIHSEGSRLLTSGMHGILDSKEHR